jgi:hypothetical protein|tara:strand:+ start:306 stop:713 length:408 start_codon:yes stop_codon:yes gene_type:complete
MQNQPVKKIFFKKRVIAYLFDSYKINETEFISDPDDFFQLGFGHIEHETHLDPHIHKEIDRKINETSEFIYVVSGRMIIEIMALDGANVTTVEVHTGYGFLQCFGGHKITIDAGTKYFELKQGPYLGHAFDKVLV